MQSKLQAVLAALAFGMAIQVLPAQEQLPTGVPATLNYQGRVMQNGQPFDGTGHFVFVIYEGGAIRWSNKTGFNPEATDPAPEWPEAAIALAVRNGVFSLALGTGVGEGPNQPLSMEVFFNFMDPQMERRGPRQNLTLKTWFSPVGVGPYTKLEPDITFASVPYAQIASVAQTVKKGGLTAESLAPDAVLATLAPGTFLLSMYAMDPTLQANGFVPLAEPMVLAGQVRHVYKKQTEPVYRFGVVDSMGNEIETGQVVLTGNDQETTFTIRNLGNRTLTAWTAGLTGPGSSAYDWGFASPSLEPGMATMFTLTKSSAPESACTLSLGSTETGMAFKLSLPVYNEGFTLISPGSFAMGDQSGALLGSTNERPVHNVNVSGFHMAKSEVTKALWDEVRQWGIAHGYTDLSAGGGKAPYHPVHSISWNDAVKWCNALSEMEDLMPCYTVGGGVFRTGSGAPDCNWISAGYRLPTEAEWEKAARGGMAGLNFPWGDTISHDQANYRVYSNGGATNYYNYDLTPRPPGLVTHYNHPDYSIGSSPYTSPFGSFAPNGHGLYDVAGNVREWCWDWYSADYYTTSPGTDPRGTTSGSFRVIRDGGWDGDAHNCRVSRRNASSPASSGNTIGFRLARSFVPSGP